MTGRAALQDLLTVSRLRYDRQRQVLAGITAEEDRIRSDLARLDDMGRAQQAGDPMRVVGADLLWQGWLARARSALNMRLARQLALKDQELARVKRAFGRVTALEAILEAQRRSEGRRRTANTLNEAITEVLRHPPDHHQ